MSEAPEVSEASKSSLPDITKFPVWGQAFIVPYDLLVIPEWNVNEMAPSRFNELVKEIDKNEFDEPCLVVPIPDSDKFLVVGGCHRSAALKVLKKEGVPCVLKKTLDPTDIDALKAYSVRRNHLKGGPNEEKLSALTAHLAKQWKKSENLIRRRLLIKAKKMKTIKPQQSSGAAGAASTSAGTSDVDAVGKSISDDAPKEASKGFVPGPKKGKTAEEAAQIAQQSVSLAERHRMIHGAQALAKVIMANIEEDKSLKNGYAWFGHGGKGHLILAMDSEMAGMVEKMVKCFQADQKPIMDFLKDALRDKVDALTLPKKKQKKRAKKTKAKSKKSKAKVPSKPKAAVKA